MVQWFLYSIYTKFRCGCNSGWFSAWKFIINFVTFFACCFGRILLIPCLGLGTLGTSCLFSWLFRKSTCFLTSPSTNILACLGWLQVHREKLFKVSSNTLLAMLLIISKHKCSSNSSLSWTSYFYSFQSLLYGMWIKLKCKRKLKKHLWNEFKGLQKCENCHYNSTINSLS